MFSNLMALIISEVPATLGDTSKFSYLLNKQNKASII